MSRSVSVVHTVRIRATPEEVWDYTQDWTRRAEWDPGVVSAEVVQHEPAPVVRARGSGGVSFTAAYKLFRRPERTSLVMEDCRPAWMGGGGSWSYEAAPDGRTEWTQHNTITVSGSLRGALLGWVVRKMLARNTRISMERAKAVLEADRPS